MLLLPIRRCHPDLYYKIEGQFFHWMLSIVAMWSWTAGYNSEYCSRIIIYKIDLEVHIRKSFLAANLRLFFLLLSFSFAVVELGDDITPCQIADTRTLLIANHQSTADVPLLMACFNAKPDVLPNIMWIMDRVFKFTNFGIVSVLHQDFFVRAVSSKIPKHKNETEPKNSFFFQFSIYRAESNVMRP